MTPMTGQYSHNIDAKGRLFIPASFRKALGQTFHVTVGQDHCLAVYSDDRWNEYMKDVMLMEMDPETGAQPLMKQVFFF